MIILFSNFDQVRSHIHMVSVGSREYYYQVIVASDRSKLSLSLCTSLDLSEYFITSDTLIFINPFSGTLCELEIKHGPERELSVNFFFF